MKKYSADIIHVHMPNPLAELSYLLSGNSGKLIAHFHSDIVRQKMLLSFYEPFLTRFYDLADRIIVPTPHHIACSNMLTRYREKCKVVPYRISLDEFGVDETEKMIVGELKEEVPTLLFVGRLVYYKGLDVLIRAMSSIDARLWIVGTGNLEASLRRLTAKLGLENKIDFLGSVPRRELICRYHACDLVVLPSVANSEMFGMVQLEAMACNKPVVATNLPTGVSWVNQNGITGFLVPPGDELALVRVINRLIDSHSLRDELGGAGRERVEEVFTIDNMVNGVLEVYNEAMQ